jgi:hypothetical protein
MSATERRNNWRYFQGDAGRETVERARDFAGEAVFGESLQSGGIHAPREPNVGFRTESQYDAFKKSDKLYGYAPKNAAYQFCIPGEAAGFREMMTIRTGWTSAFSTGELRP